MECVESNIVFTCMWVCRLPSFDWVLSWSQGIPQSACAIYWQGPEIQIDLNRDTDGVFLDSNKILKSEVQI